jgi:NAD(P)H dehydrogenase (quinone)
MVEILVLYYSLYGSTADMARLIASGVEEVPGAVARLRTVPDVWPTGAPTLAKPYPEQTPYASLDDLRQCDGLALGSPTHFGNMSAALKHFIDSTGPLWFAGDLAGKPAGVFTATGSMHGGQETTLLSMMLPLLHHGMVLVGVPSTEKALESTRSGGTPYGPSRRTGGNPPVSDEERQICRSLGQRLARMATLLKQDRTP